MAAGDLTQLGTRLYSLSLLVAATATNSAPSGASAGVALTAFDVKGLGWSPRVGSLRIWSSAGSGTMTATIRLWGYDSLIADWLPLGPGADATKGTINDGNALGETGANIIRHTEPVDLPCHFERLYVEVTAIGGTATAINAALVVERYAEGN